MVCKYNTYYKNCQTRLPRPQIRWAFVAEAAKNEESATPEGEFVDGSVKLWQSATFSADFVAESAKNEESATISYSFCGRL